MKPTALMACCLCAAAALPSRATTKGLNQIVTPDIQPLGIVSLSFQAQHPIIGNSLQAQVEVGLTRNFEIAAFQGFRPSEQVLNAELGLVQKKEFLLSAGVANWNMRGTTAYPYLEAGYYRGPQKLMAGVMQERSQTQAVLGYAYQVSPAILLQLDYQSGRANFATAGFTWNITKTLQLNPALYVANRASHGLYGYAVLTWNVTGWK